MRKKYTVEELRGSMVHVGSHEIYYDVEEGIIHDIKSMIHKLRISLSNPHHTQLKENLVDSQSDSATNSKEERR